MILHLPPDSPPIVQAAAGLVLALHIGGGTVGLAAGTVAAVAPKGGRLHRMSGAVFVIAMLVMAGFAAYLGVVVPDRANIFIAAFAAYLIGTGWLAARRRGSATGLVEKAALLLALILCAPFAILTFQLATGLPPLFTSTVPFKGPVRMAIYAFTAVLAIAAAGDARTVFAGALGERRRIARHLWRMCLGLTLAAGSAFTNGLPRLLPGPMHVTPIFFLPQFLPLGLLLFWMVRVRFGRTPWPTSVSGSAERLADLGQGRPGV